MSQKSFADLYLAVNPMFLDLASTLGVDLWTLDYLWWYIAPPTPPQSLPSRISDPKDRIASAPPKAAMSQSTPSTTGLPAQTFSLPSGLVFSLGEAESRLIRFCREEFGYYDAIADMVPNRIEPIDVIVTVAINSLVNNAALIRKVHRGLAGSCESFLAKIPFDADLMTYDPDLSEFRRLIHIAVQAPQVLVAVATKVLHRKRRNFIPILDNVMIKHYATALSQPSWIEKSQSKATAASVAVEVMKAFREDLQHAFTRVLA